MSWSSALTENCPLRLPAYVYSYSNSNLLLVAHIISCTFFNHFLKDIYLHVLSLYCKQASRTLTHTHSQTHTHIMHLDVS